MGVPKILVMMTTYNGQRYVADQIDSILNQEGVDVTLRISDDRSRDDTYAVLEAAAEESPNVHISCNYRNLGCNANFLQLIYEADAEEYDFFAIADQDDVWHPNKLRSAAERISSNTSRPELYFAGVNNIDELGRSLGNEYAQYKVCALKPLSVLLVQNWALGCTMLMNGSLLKLLQSYPVDDVGRYYDAWIHAVVQCCGGFVYCDIENCYIDRRISGSNLVGLMNEKRSPAFIVKQAVGWFVHKDTQRARKHTQMAAALRDGYADYMEPYVLQIVSDVADREHSRSARQRLFKCKEIVMPTRSKTTWLRWMVLLNKF